MANSFDKKIKDIEIELLQLKTATSFTSVRSSAYNQRWQVYTGLYRAVYAAGEEPICSSGSLGSIGDEWGPPDFRTPIGTTQIIEIMTTDTDGTVKTVPLTIISNRPVISITRI